MCAGFNLPDDFPGLCCATGKAVDTDELRGLADPDHLRTGVCTACVPVCVYGTCTSGADVYCLCESGWTGTDCDTVLAVCSDEDLGSDVPINVTRTTVDGPSDHASNCGYRPESAPENTFLWTAPADGHYSFDTHGTNPDYDTILTILENDCDGAEIACDDDSGTNVFGGTTYAAGIELDLFGGDSIAIIVDGYDIDDYGEFHLKSFPTK